MYEIFVLESGRINSIEASLVILVFVFSVVWSALLHFMIGMNSLIVHKYFYFFKPFLVLMTKFFRDKHMYRRELMPSCFGIGRIKLS